MKRIVGWAMRLLGERTCRDIVAVLQEYYDQSLDPELTAIVERHLRNCPDCDAFSRTYAATIDLTGELACDDIPEEVRRRLHEALEERAATRRASGK